MRPVPIICAVVTALAASLCIAGAAGAAGPSDQPTTRYTRETQDKISENPKGPISANADTCRATYKEDTGGTCTSKIAVVTAGSCPRGEHCQLVEHKGDGTNADTPSGTCRRQGSSYSASCVKD